MLFLGNSSEVVTVVRVEFLLEDKEKSRLTKTNTWKIKNLEEILTSHLTLLKWVKEYVAINWSPDKHFYPARVVEVAISKLV